MDHIQFLMVRSTTSEEAEISGHALMATCPPQSHIDEHPEETYPHKMPDIGMGDLLKLLDLSNRLPLDGEITPVMAWALIRGEPEFAKLAQSDFDVLKEDLKAKVRCYGFVHLIFFFGFQTHVSRFGAVLEEFEVRDAFGSVMAKKEGGQYTGWPPPAAGDAIMAEA